MIWYKDIWGFMRHHQLGLFFPSLEMTLAEQLNCAMRFAIYFAVVLLVVRGSINALYIVIAAALMTFLIFESETRTKQSKDELFETLNIADTGAHKHAYKPTRDNPFMNIMVTDYTSFPNRPAAGAWVDPGVKGQVRRNFEDGLTRGTDDMFNKMASDRQYYTMPSTTIPNNQGDFARWLYHNPGLTHKEKGVLH